MTLLTRLAQAEHGSRELDALIHRAVHPEFSDMTALADGWLVGGNHLLPEGAPHYTTSDDAIRLAIDWSKVTLCEIRYLVPLNKWRVFLHFYWPDSIAHTVKPTIALALSEAWIKCLRAREGEKR